MKSKVPAQSCRGKKNHHKSPETFNCRYCRQGWAKQLLGLGAAITFFTWVIKALNKFTFNKWGGNLKTVILCLLRSS